MEQQAKRSVKTHPLRVPPQLTSFIGRTDELVEITRLLADPACRLLTLLGPGGIGKTRLAVQAATELLDDFVHGVYFVPLQAIQSTDFLVSAIADAVPFSVSGQETPRVQLLNHLRDKEILLVLDNFEQLLAPPSSSPQARMTGGIELLTDILIAAPDVKLLVTSREVLNLQEEWLYPVPGLPFPNSLLLPDEATEERGERYSAVQLFVERAGRVRRDFSLADEQEAVIRICQLVEGMPLALELAASWTKSLPCAVIAAEIQRNLDFLTTSLRNVPDRQRSMRAVFDHSWQLLSEDEGNVFRRLSVFHGSFRRAAAEQVTKATLPILTSLVDKSLLRWEPDGRYQIHELLRQYAAEHLVLSPDDIAQVYDRHCAYYADFLQQRAEAMTDSRQREATQEIAAELENLRAAWEWSVQQVSVPNIQKIIFTFYQFCDSQSRFQEGTDAFEKATASLESAEPSLQRDSTLAILLVYLGWLYIRLGWLEKARVALERSQTIFNDLGVPPPPGLGTDPSTALGVLANTLGNYAEAEKLGEAARQLGQARVDKQNLQIAFYILANAVLAQGQYAAARRYAQQAYDLTQETDNRWFMAYILSDLGNVARALGDYVQARRHYQASYAIKQEFNDPEGTAVALNNLGRIAWLQGDYQEAKRLYQQSLATYRKINDQGGLATSLTGLGITVCAMGKYQAARQYLFQALQITNEIQFVPLTLVILIGIGELLWQTGQPERGIELLTLVLHHPASDQETKEWAKRDLERYQVELPPDLSQIGVADSLGSTVITLLAELTSLIEGESQTDKGTEEPMSKEAREGIISPGPLPFNSSMLMEPLTPRELEVLHLIAEGLTNQQIADKLVISVGTAKFYTSQIYSKLNVSSRTQAVARARELNLLA